MPMFRVLCSVVILSISGVVAAAGQPVTITFLEFNDFHAHLTPHMDAVRADGKVALRERGGLARVSTLVKQIRGETPNTILMNIGDTFHGGVEAMYTVGNAIVGPINALGIDVGVPGNWDYAYGPYVFLSRFTGHAPDSGFAAATAPAVATIERPNYPNLAANLMDRETGELVLPPTLIKTIGGVKVGFIGVTSDIVPQMYRPLSAGMQFTQGKKRYQRLLDTYSRQLREHGCQVVVVMSELGIQKDYALAQVVAPGSIDVFFSAHTHEVIETPLTSASGALVVEAGNDGYLGRMDVTVAANGVVSRNWTLEVIDPSIPEDPQMKALVDAARAPFLAHNVHMADPTPGSEQTLNAPIDTVIGYSAATLNRREALESSFNDLLTDLMRARTHTDLALAPGFRFDAVIPAAGYLSEDATVATGAITLEDVYRFLPVGFTLATGDVTGARLREIMEDTLTHVFSTDAFAQGGGWFDGFSGLNAEVTLTNPDGQRLTALYDANWHPIADDQVLSITGCKRPMEPSDVLCSYSGFANVTAITDPKTGAPLTAIDLLADSLGKGVDAATQRRNIVDLSGLPEWPESPYVQPLTGAQ